MLSHLQELWLNDNQIDTVALLEPLRELKMLQTVYLERNPIQASLGPGYRGAVLQIVPNIEQLDALLLKATINII